eukprot:4134142-Amphidinium_carterae.1
MVLKDKQAGPRSADHFPGQGVVGVSNIEGSLACVSRSPTPMGAGCAVWQSADASGRPWPVP